MPTSIWNPRPGREIRSERVEDGIRYILPPRELGPWRVIGIVPLLFAAAALGFGVQAVRLVWPIGQRASSQPWPAASSIAVMVVVAAFMIWFVRLPLLVGLALLLGSHTEIVAAAGRLRVTEVTPLLRRTWRRKVASIRQLRVTGLSSFDQPLSPTAQAAARRWAAILVENQSSGARWPFLIGPGYPRDLLIPLANDLSQQCGRALMQTAAYRGQTAPTLPIVTIEPLTGEATEEAAAPVQRPPTSTAELTQQVSSTLIVLPPMGFKGPVRVLAGFAVIWLIAIAVFSLGMGSGAATDETEMSASGRMALMGAMWAIGLLLLTISVHVARRKVTLLAELRSLDVTQESPLRRRHRQIAAVNITAIRVGRSNWEVNDRRLPELQIHLKEGKPIGLLAGRDESELRWLADVLQSALRL